MSEHDEQVALFRWADYQECKHPELKLMHAIPNGGHRHVAVAARLKDEGVKPGVPDIHLPIAKGGYHGLYIEMKYGKNKPLEHQEMWLKMLEAAGQKTAVCYSFEEARDVIVRYLRGG